MTDDEVSTNIGALIHQLNSMTLPGAIVAVALIAAVAYVIVFFIKHFFSF